VAFQAPTAGCGGGRCMGCADNSSTTLEYTAVGGSWTTSAGEAEPANTDRSPAFSVSWITFSFVEDGCAGSLGVYFRGGPSQDFSSWSSSHNRPAVCHLK
jgi:hypothetical protein